VGNAAYFLVWTFMAMGLCVVWGYCGALSFGQTAFFGLAGYAYGVITINIGAAYGFTILALLASVALATVFAASSAISCSTGRSAACSSASSPCR
jgi:ABC-type branched-subunit amino acid transport system permease subunit